MKRLLTTATILSGLLTGIAGASEAQTSAGAGSNGVATATARYEGDVGFARTQTNSGRITTAQGVAVGFDQDGLSLSVSRAVDTPWGPAVATNFNLSIDRDGDVSHSVGRSVAHGALERSATAGGGASTGPRGTAFSTAGGRTDPYGRVEAQTRAEQHRRIAREPRRVIVLRRNAE